jgi:mono/diheme cytochrome c family protein
MKWLTSVAIVVLGLAALSCSQQTGTPAASAQSAQQSASEPAVADSAIAAPDSAAAAANLKHLEAGAAAIFQTSCTGCHGADSPPKNLSLDPAVFAGTTVGVASTELDTLKLVEPGRPDRSYLIMKVAGDPRIKGRRMPKGEDPLTADQIKTLTDWVVALAPAR